MTITGEQIKGIMVGTVGAKDDTEKAFAFTLMQNLPVVSIDVNDNATAATAQGERMLFGRVPQSIKIESVYLIPGVAVTANDTNYAVFTVRKMTSGASPVTICTFQTTITAGTGNLSLQVPVAGTLSTVAGALNLAAGDSLVVELTKQGTGVAISGATAGRSASIQVQYSRGS